MSVAGSRIAEDSSRKSVRKYPGPTIVAVMPNSSSSRTSDSVKPATSEELPAWLFAAERYVGIDRRGPAGRQVAGKERGTDQRNRRHHQHPRIDDGDVQLEIRARDRPADEANRQPEADSGRRAYAERAAGPDCGRAAHDERSRTRWHMPLPAATHRDLPRRHA